MTDIKKKIAKKNKIIRIIILITIFAIILRFVIRILDVVIKG